MEYGADKRREKLPTTSEVAAIIPDEYDDPSHRDIVVSIKILEFIIVSILKWVSII